MLPDWDSHWYASLENPWLSDCCHISGLPFNVSERAFRSLHLTYSAQYGSHGNLNHQQSLRRNSSEADVVSAISLGQASTLTTSFQISLSTYIDSVRAFEEGGALGEVSAVI